MTPLQSNADAPILDAPDIVVSAKDVFGMADDLPLLAFSEPDPYVPDLDPDYIFEPNTTLALLTGFQYNRRTLIQGRHGTGKSTHIEQVAARLNWPCVRVNLDSHISRLDLVGRDALTLRNGKQITEFREGVLPWSLQRPCALVFDEYDAGRPEVMFVIQRVLEANGQFTLLDQNRVIRPHPFFRLFATANTIGLGDSSGLYQGAQPINQAQMDRWSIVSTLDYLDPKIEQAIVLQKSQRLAASLDNPTDAIAMLTQDLIATMVKVANLTREAFANGDLSTIMSPRTVILWAENAVLLKNAALGFRFAFLNKCDENERRLVSELYQRGFAEGLPDDAPPFVRPAQ